MIVNNDLFPGREEVYPKIYAYEDMNPNHKGLLKIGYTDRYDVNVRIREQFPVLTPEEKPYKVVFCECAMREDGTVFRDKTDIHPLLRNMGFENPNGEWFRCSVDDLKKVYLAVYNRSNIVENRTENFKLRKEQKQAIKQTISYFEKAKVEENIVPHFLWNAKMRFGKTFTTYKLAQEMKWKRILILTFKPAVESAWKDDLEMHIDFSGWQFVSRDGLSYDECDKDKPIVCFGSFQDYLGRNSAGGIKVKNEWVHKVEWDCVVLDEYHYGAWRESAKDLFEGEDSKSKKDEVGSGLEYYDEAVMPIKTKHYLYLSGTPFRAISSGEFIEEQIYNWTYSDEQNAKEEWDDKDGKNLL